MRYMHVLMVLILILASVAFVSGDSATVVASKVVCDDELDLPNSGGGGLDITSKTAHNFVITHSGCHLQSGWKFQWAYAGTSNPGDNTGEAGGAWHTFGPTKSDGTATTQVTFSISNDDILVREILQTGYLKFTGTSISAEMYCHTDVGNYDNYDEITDMQTGKTYYCVAFNVERPVCVPSFLDKYQCNDSWQQRQYRRADCSVEWLNYRYCDYDCSNRTCVSGCTPGYTDDYQCSGNWQQRQFQNQDCTTQWKNYLYCDYGCANGKCVSGCTPGYTNDYQCSGDWVQRKFTNANCSTKWQDYQQCANGCSNGQCITECEPGYTGQYQCSGNWRQREYKDYDCSKEWRNYEYCSSGCSGGACKLGSEPYCKDSDNGMVWSVQGNTYGVDSDFKSFSKSDYCSGSILSEYSCDGAHFVLTQHECNNGCADGQCVSTAGCTDECPYWGKNECHSGRLRVCGYYDADVCLDWDYQDTSCDDECDVGWEDDYRCSGDKLQRRYMNDDCDEEWKNYKTCENGCEDDECVEGDCDAHYLSNYRCSGNWQQRQYRDSDCDTEWRNYNYCGNGCSAGRCITQPATSCGDGTCNGVESCSTCQRDCGQCPVRSFCGDYVCNNGETCLTCPQDCGACARCGDAVCNGAETCFSCMQDCGQCAITQPYVNTNRTNPPAATIVTNPTTPTSGVITGDIDLIWVLIGIAVLINIILAIILVQKLRHR